MCYSCKHRLRSLHILEDVSSSLRANEKLQLEERFAKILAMLTLDLLPPSVDLRSRPVTYRVEQNVFRSNFKQSRLVDHYNSKLDNQFGEPISIARHRLSYYELEDVKGKATLKTCVLD